MPGVYIYKDGSGTILYVGKARDLRNRVASYFQPPTTLGPKTAALMAQVKNLEYIEVGSEIEALLLESKLINRFKPQYNIASKDDKSPYYIHLSREKFPKPFINHIPHGSVAGPFLSGLIARKILKYFRKVAPYCTATRPVKRPCLYSHMGLCFPCPGNPSTTQKNYLKNIGRLKRLLKGEFSRVLTGLKKQMLQASQLKQYELAADLRDKIKSLETLLQAPVLPEEYLTNPNLVADKRHLALESLQKDLQLPVFPQRIEMYDIANLMGKAATGAMTVALGGEVNSNYFRHFIVRTKDTPDDVGMLAEVISRRLKRDDWPKPDLIVLDGGKSQLSIFRHIKIDIPVLGLAKREDLIFSLSGEGIRLPVRHPGLQLLQNLRDEAHRFSRRLHHKLRQKSIKK